LDRLVAAMLDVDIATPGINNEINQLNEEQARLQFGGPTPQAVKWPVHPRKSRRGARVSPSGEGRHSMW